MAYHCKHHCTRKFVLLFALGTWGIACKSSKTSSDHNSEITATPTPTLSPTPYRGTLDIREKDVEGTTLAVSKNKTSNWQFIASYANGAEGQITSIQVTSSATPASMKIFENRITFTPTSSNEMNGSFVVYAKGPNSDVTESKSFIWGEGGSAFSSFLRKVFPNASKTQALALSAQQALFSPLEAAWNANHCQPMDLSDYLANKQNSAQWANVEALAATLKAAIIIDLGERDETFAEQEHDEAAMLAMVIGATLCSKQTLRVLQDCYPTTYEVVSSGILVKKDFNLTACAAAQ